MAELTGRIVTEESGSHLNDQFLGDRLSGRVLQSHSRR
jgi:hypothetical protein